MNFLNQKTFWLLYLSSILLLSSCSVYTSQVSPPVLIESKGEIEFDGGISIIPSSSVGVNTSISYGLTEKIQSQLFVSHIGQGFDGEATTLQGIIGYSFFTNEHLSFKSFVGYFYGSANLIGDSSNLYLYNFKGNYQSLFGQFQFILKKKKYSLGVTLKIGEFYSTEKSTWKNNTINDKGVLFEPSIFYIKTFKNKKFRLHFLYSIPFLNLKKYNHDGYGNEPATFYGYSNPYGNFGIGVSYFMSTNYKSK